MSSTTPSANFLLGIAARTLIGAAQPFFDSASKCNASIWSMALHRGYDPCCNGGASQHPEKTAVATATRAGLPKTPEMRKDAGAPAPSAKYPTNAPLTRDINTSNNSIVRKPSVSCDLFSQMSPPVDPTPARHPC
jgi:hypothetical protein